MCDITWLLMHRIFPHAAYGSTRAFQLTANLSPMEVWPGLLFLAPVLYTAWHLRRLLAALDGPTVVLLIASAWYLASWLTVGRMEEVRIFVPFAFALAPLTACVLAGRVEAEPQPAGL